MKHSTNIAIGVLMVGAAITAPIVLFYPLKLQEWWQVILLNIPCWILSWFGSRRATRAWISLRAAIFEMEREQALAEMDNRYQPKETQ